MDLDKLRVNGERLRSSLEAMAKIGATPGGGVQRLALSLEDKQARDLLVSWLEQIGLDVTIDEMGNIFGRRQGREDDLPPVIAGSHADSQPKGGRLDGILGVMGALEVLRTLEEHGVETLRPVALVDWTNEEGSRFAPAMMASGVWAGKLDRDWAWQRTDVDGMVFGEELERVGYKGALPCAIGPFTPTSSCTSSKVRGWSASTGRSACPRAYSACTGTTSTWTARRITSVPRPWPGAVMLWSRPRR